MNRDDDELTRAKMRHPASRHQMIRDVEAFAREAALKGIDVAPLRTRPWESKLGLEIPSIPAGGDSQ